MIRWTIFYIALAFGVDRYQIRSCNVWTRISFAGYIDDSSFDNGIFLSRQPLGIKWSISGGVIYLWGALLVRSISMLINRLNWLSAKILSCQVVLCFPAPSKSIISSRPPTIRRQATSSSIPHSVDAAATHASTKKFSILFISCESVICSPLKEWLLLCLVLCGGVFSFSLLPRFWISSWIASITVFIQRCDSVSCDFSLDSSGLSFAGDSCLSMTGLKDLFTKRSAFREEARMDWSVHGVRIPP